MEYNILQTENRETLIALTIAWINKGWEPLGGAFAVHSVNPGAFATGMLWCQTIIKR
jgi:hypothetical protein